MRRRSSSATNGDGSGGAKRNWDGPFAVDDALSLQKISALRETVWRSEPEIYDARCLEASLLHDEHDDHGHHWVIKSAGEVVAAARLCLHRDPCELPNHAEYRDLVAGIPAPICSFNRIVVEPAVRRQGISRALTAVRLETARKLGAKSIVVEAGPNRMPPLRELGFVALGLSGAYPGDLVPYTLMMLDMSR